MSTIAYVSGPEEAAGYGAFVDDADRPYDRVTNRALRPGRTPVGILVALVLSVVAWAATAEATAVILGWSPSWIPLDRLTAFGARPWSDPVVAGFAALLVLTGVIMVALAVTPGRPRLVPLETADPLMAAGLTRSGLRRTLA
ncbi:MAG TPA: hypothetical protein VIR33_04635, partial [Thermopolyspora sp.]